MAVTQLMLVSSDQDRYGRVVALVRVSDSQRSILEILIEQGHARVAARIGDKACADILLRSERVARGARARSLGRPQFRPFASGTSRPDCSAGPICTGRGQGIVGPRKRRHNIFELREALDARFYGNES
jgi:Staphylococcal nuclease homologue